MTDAGRTLATGEAAGGTTVMPLFAVENSASFAMMKDAVGTEVALFQASTQIGAGIVRLLDPQGAPFGLAQAD